MRRRPRQVSRFDLGSVLVIGAGRSATYIGCLSPQPVKPLLKLVFEKRKVLRHLVIRPFATLQADDECQNLVNEH